jgi:NAD-dependent DNA ligase
VPLNLPTKWKIHKGIHVSLLEPFIQGNQEANLEKVLDAANPREADDECYVQEVMCSAETKAKVTYFVSGGAFRLRGIGAGTHSKLSIQ